MGIVEIETALSAQLKGVEEIVASIGDSEIGKGIGIEDLKNLETVGIDDSVCVDMVAEVDWGMIGMSVWMEAVVTGKVSGSSV
jgi:hypothetical protein